MNAKASEVAVITPLEVLNNAVAKGVDPDQLAKLMELHERHEANEARKAFVVAMTGFREKAIVVYRNKQVKYGQTDYKHATLDAAVEAAAPALAEFGLSHRWETKQEKSAEGERVEVTCIITHELGHSESTTMQSYADTSGAKNAIQAIGSAVSYLERYTFLAATGLVTKDQDDDGRNAGKIVDQDSIEYMAAVREHWDTIVYIKDRIAAADHETPKSDEAEAILLQAGEAYDELGDEMKHFLWKAPTKGGIFTTHERAQLKEVGNIRARARMAAE